MTNLKFLQYTIHFINECDLYLKKLHQQYQIKQLESIDLKLKETTPTSIIQNDIIKRSPGRRPKIKFEQSETKITSPLPPPPLFKCLSTPPLNYLRTPTKGGASFSTATTTTTTSPVAVQITETCNTNKTYANNFNNIIKAEEITQTINDSTELIFKPIIKDQKPITKSNLSIIEQIMQTHNTNNAKQMLKKNEEQQKVLPLLIKLSPKNNEIAKLRLIEKPVKINVNNKMNENTVFKNNNDQIYTKPNLKLKNCYVLIERFDESKINKNGVYYLNEQSSKDTKKLHSKALQQQSVKKLKLKSKTFPVASLTNIHEHVDAIVSVNSPYFSNSNNINQLKRNSILTTKSSRSKSRTTSLSNENFSQIPSPAELLRKYSSIKGHICEMDRLFKGSSVTLTQCLECENLRKCPEAFYDRSLPVNTISNGNLKKKLVY